MKTSYTEERPDGYRETIQRGLWGVRQMGRGITRGAEQFRKGGDEQ